MNRARVAALLRELAEAIEELPVAPASQPRAKRVRRSPMLTRPAGDVPEAVAGQARKILRDRGFT